MRRTARTLVGTLALLLLIVGTALATRSLDAGKQLDPVAASHEPSNAADAGAQLTDDHAAQIVNLLAAAGIDVSADDLNALAAKYGVGGAVRLEMWAKATGKSVDELGAMFDAGMGWGAIAKKLEADDSSLNLPPGIGSIMGHGHGHQNAHASANHDLGTPKPESTD